MPKLSQYVSAIGPDLVTILAAVESMEPEAAAFFASELSAAKVEFTTVGGALAALASASIIGEIPATLNVLKVAGGLITFITTAYENGEKLFGASWPTVQAAFDNLLDLFKGTVVTAATNAVAPSPAAAPAAPAPATVVAIASAPASA